MADEKLTRDQAIRKVAEMMARATESGKKLTGPMVMNALGVSKPTALSYISAARAIATTTALANLHETRAERGQAPARPPAPRPNQDQQMATGIDMVGTLVQTRDDLVVMKGALQDDLDQVRFFLFGGPQGNAMPGLCRECNAELVDRLPIKETPRELMGRMGVTDLGKMYSELIKLHKAMNDLVGRHNSVLEQFFNFQAMDRFMRNVQAAISTVAPEHAKAIAAEIRRLGTQGESEE